MSDENKESRLGRRQFITRGITTGFALAVSPVTKAVVTTPTEGITGEMITIPVGDVSLPAYWAAPKGKGPYPTILVIQEIFGVHAYIQDVCRRFAKAGYVAVAPYLYYREGDVTKLEKIEDIASQVVSKVPQAQVWSDLDATVKWLETKKVANPKKLGITGFCWGGNVTWMYSWHNPNVKAGVAWYGRVKPNPSPNAPKTPVEIAPELKVPVLGLYGAKDTGIPLDTLDLMRTELGKGKSKSEIVVFPDSEHGFHADYRPSYNEKDAKEGWKKCLAWFKSHGV